jgi:phosphatidylinositol dimannoside acyltransferase
MPIDPQKIINSSYGVALASFLGRSLPPGAGSRLADFVADWIAARRNWNLVHAVRANQWVISGGALDSTGLDHIVRESFRSTAHSIYELYHYTHDADGMRGLIEFNAHALELINRPQFTERGILVVGIHFSNFDLVLQGGVLRGGKGMGVTLNELPGGIKLQTEMREKTGLTLLPASVSGIKRATEYLQAGGIVLTGIDRPLPESHYRPCFFGRPAALPAHHIVMALKARVPIIVLATILRPDGRYHVLSSEIIEMQHHPDRRTEITHNAERVLKIAEGFILQAPHQWSMTHPVWPEALAEVPD